MTATSSVGDNQYGGPPDLAEPPALTISDHGFLAYVVIANGRWWNGLEPDRQQALLAALAEATGWVRAEAQGINQAALERLAASGQVAVRRLLPAERDALKAAFAPAYGGIERRLGKGFMAEVYAALGRGAVGQGEER